MNKYTRTPEHILDFHGNTVKEVEEDLNAFFRNNTFNYIRIITGKGVHSQNGPVVREFVKKYLSKKRIRYSQSKPQDGGEGALEVFIE